MQIDIEAIAQETAKRTNMILEEQVEQALRDLIREVIKEEIDNKLHLYFNTFSKKLSLSYDDDEVSYDYIEFID